MSYLGAQIPGLAMLLALAACEAPGGSISHNAPRPSATVATTMPAKDAEPRKAPDAEAEAEAEPAKVAPDGMIAIPAGVFLMGANHALGNPEERPAHEAMVAAFYLDRTEVTVDAYQRCVKAKKCPPVHTNRRFCNTEYSDRGKHPINCIDLTMADNYCRWAGKRLPTEREWEYAASGGRERRTFSWGNTDPSATVSCYDHPGGSCPVATFAAGAFGLHDMTGNVWEWTASHFKPYPSGSIVDPIVATKNYVYRGGSWSRRFPKWMRNILRNRYKPKEYSAAIGMRCAKGVTPLACPKNSEARAGACVRVRGEVLCQPLYRHNGRACVPGAGGAVVAVASTTSSRVTGAPGHNTVKPAKAPGSASAAAPASVQVSRSRTPKYDDDCRRHWPHTPASYLFKGGANYPARKPVVKAAGCVPRDMGWSWTSACCPG